MQLDRLCLIKVQRIAWKHSSLCWRLNPSPSDAHSSGDCICSSCMIMEVRTPGERHFTEPWRNALGSKWVLLLMNYAKFFILFCCKFYFYNHSVSKHKIIMFLIIHDVSSAWYMLLLETYPYRRCKMSFSCITVIYIFQV